MDDFIVRSRSIIRGAPRELPVRAVMLGLLVASAVCGCATRDARHAQAPSPESLPPPLAAAPGSVEFTVPESMNDTWNTVGQVLVALDGVTYESRAQMLGIYAVRYRGEQMLVRTQAVVLRDPEDHMLTRVTMLKMDGKPNADPAAVELLALFAQRVPSAIPKYRQPVRLKKGRSR